MKNCNGSSERRYISAYSLAGIGVGSLIGAGFFLGSSLALNQAGPSVTLAFLLGGLIMSQVLGAMTSIGINKTPRRTFRYFSEEMLGPYIGTLLGWIVFCSGVLTICSEALAASVFLKFWFPHIPGSVFAFVVLLAVIAINAMGLRNLGAIESGMSLVKILVIVAFIILGVIFLITHGISSSLNPFTSLQDYFPKGIQGMLKSMLIVVFTYGGISAIAMASSEVRNPQKEIPKATLIVTLGILILYVASAFVLTLLVSWDTVNTSESPFISALSKVGVGPASDIVNTVILVSTVSVMLATFYSSTRMLVSLSRNHRIFFVFTKETSGHFFRNAWIFVSILTLLIIGMSLLVSSRLFSYLVSASSYFTFFNWTINLLTYLIWRKRYKSELKYKSHLTLGNPGVYATLAAILLLFAFSLSVQDFRVGFYISLIIFILISFIYWIGSKRKSN